MGERGQAQCKPTQTADDWAPVEELEKKYRELLEDAQNVKTTAGSIALATARKNIQELLKERGHHGFDYNC